MTNPQRGKLRDAIQRFIDTVNLSDPLNRGIKNLSDKIEDWLKIPYRSMLVEISKMSPMFDALNPDKMGTAEGKRPAILLTLVGFCITVGISAGMSLLQPVMKLLSYATDKKVLSARFSPPDAVQAFRVGTMQKEVIYEWLSQLGWGRVEVDLWFKMLTHQFDAGEVISLYRRGEIGEDEFRHRLKIVGYEDRDIFLFEKMTTLIPGIGDLISMAVRDAWNDTAAAKFGYDEDFPTEVGQWTEKQGLSGAWAKRYWRAHWNLPSPQMGYEMMHRLREGVTKDPFTRETMELMLRIGDYPKFFRDKMIEISYNPYTRVDVRRMYKLGILDRDQVKGSYLDLGYDEIHAENMTEFTIKFETGAGESSPDKYSDVSFALMQRAYILDMITLEDYKNHLKALKYSEDEINLVTSLTDASKVIDRIPDKFPSYIQENENFISKAYTSRMISKSEATRQLSDIGYTQKAIDVLLALSDYNYQASQKGRAIGLIETAYNNGSYDRGAAVSELGKLGLAGTEQDQLMTEFDTAKKHRSKHMSAADYKKCYQQGVIQEDEYKNYLVGEGYTDYDITLIMKLATPTEEV